MNNDPGGAAFAAKAVKLRSNIHPLIPHSPTRKRTPRFASVEAMVARLKPADPVQVLRPHAIKRKAQWFVEQFPGDVMYAVKTNPDPRVLTWLHEAGIRHFDVASLGEVRLVRTLFPEAQAYFMHPVKSREAIAEAYFQHGVRHFSLDTHAELAKIMAATGGADDLSLHVRLAIPNDKAAYALSGKFGIALEEATSLIQATRRAAHQFGICFHVGSQCMDPQAYVTTIGYVRDLLLSCDARLDMIDVGGGFPSAYPGMTPPPLADYMTAIRAGLAGLPGINDMRVLCEPGRALVAEGGSVLVRVELRKGNMLYINDGSFGSLFDAAHTEFAFPAKAIRQDGAFQGDLQPFGLFGPTCDSMDVMRGPFHLPADINEGDWIEIGQLGAYGATMRTRFNGYWSDLSAEVADEPLLKAE